MIIHGKCTAAFAVAIRCMAADFLLASYRGAASVLTSPRAAKPPATPDLPQLNSGPLTSAPSMGAAAAKVVLTSTLTARSMSTGSLTYGSRGGCGSAGTFVEGSLSSVTASTRSQQGIMLSSFMGRRRCHGLAELHDNMRSALRGVLVPAREVCALNLCLQENQVQSACSAVTGERITINLSR